MWKYALRYLPLFLLALILLTWRALVTHMNYLNALVAEPTPSVYMQREASPFPLGTLFYGLDMLSNTEGWAVGGTFREEANRSNVIRVVGNEGMIFHYVNGHWIQIETFKQPLLSISMSSMNKGWAVGNHGVMLRYDGGGWNEFVSEATQNLSFLRDVVMISDSDGWAVGAHGTILHYDGESWSRVPSPVTADLYSIAMQSAIEGWAVGAEGTLLHYAKGQWKNVPVDLEKHIALNDVLVVGNNEVWAVGTQGTLLHYRLGTWEQVLWLNENNSWGDQAQSEDLLSIAMLSSRSGWISTNTYLLEYKKEVWMAFTSYEQTEQLKSSEYAFFTMDAINEQEIWAAGCMSKLPYSSQCQTVGIFQFKQGIWRVNTSLGY